MNYLFYLVPVASILALLFAWLFYRQMRKEDEGTPTMKEIAQYVREGAMAYLKQQYKVVLIVFIVLALLFAFMAYVLHVQNGWVPFAFLTGGFFSALAGYIGMRTATYALGVIDFRKNDFASAIERMNSIIGVDDALSQSAYLYLGQSRMKLGDMNSAAIAFEKAANMDHDAGIKEVAFYNYAVSQKIGRASCRERV